MILPAILLSAYSYAACTKQEVMKLIDKGFNKAEISSICDMQAKSTTKVKPKSKWITPTNATCRRKGGKLFKGICKANWQQAKNICRASGGRLPSKSELIQVISDCGGYRSNIETGYSANPGDLNYHSCYKRKGFASYSYWSSTTDDGYAAYVINFGIGYQLHYSHGNYDKSVRCVRVGQKEGAHIDVDGKKKVMTGEGDHTIKVAKAVDESHEYVTNKSVFVGKDTSTKLKQKLTVKVKQAIRERWQRKGSVVVDKKLGLMWQDDSEAKNVYKNWSSAKRYCQNLTLAGYSDWRLPSYNELLSIVDYDRYDPAIMPSFQNVNTSFYYWSSSVYVSATELAWVVDFEFGNTYGNGKTGKGYVRCVRGRQ
jgi:hypothetical protein